MAKLKRKLIRTACAALGAVLMLSPCTGFTQAADEPVGNSLNGFVRNGGNWTQAAQGITGDGGGDCFYIAKETVEDFIFESKITINSGIAASLVFRSNANGSAAYVANIDTNSNNARIFRFNEGHGATTLGTYYLPDRTKREYIVRVEVVGNLLRYFLDGSLIIECEDDAYTSGQMGFLNYSANVLYSETKYFILDENTGGNGMTALDASGVAFSPDFSSECAKYSATLPYTTESFRLTATPRPRAQLSISVYDAQKQSVIAKTDFTRTMEIPLSEGQNYIIIEPIIRGTKGATTVINVKREQDPANYRNEKYRPQFHITPEVGWLNDPNGMVYFDGEYHAFYQLDASTKFPANDKWWGHAVSTDLVNWTDLPVALSPDKYGSIWSGSAVVDHNNDSGLFDDTESKSGLIAFYTSYVPGAQRQCIAYSKDKGRTWIKYLDGDYVIDQADDPLNDEAFRDPKVFWHEESGKWMMVVAGGPLRFYSSENLLDWKPEGMQNEIHTECPDFFKLSVDGGATEKWVLSGGGVWYMIGDFEYIGGVWKFVPDTGEHINFNHAPDVYAGQSFSDIEGRRIMVWWMVNIGYPFQTGEVTDPWNGALTLPYEFTLKTIDGKIRLIQNPVPEMDILRHIETNLDGTTISEGDINPLISVKSGLLEVDALIDIGSASEVGFRVRVGNNQHTTVKYNRATSMLTLDRSKSGATPTDNFLSAYMTRVPLQNGKLKLKFYVDESSLELFSQNGEQAFTALIFPDKDSVGMEFYAKGGTAMAEKLSVYTLKSMYREPVTQPKPPTDIKIISRTDTITEGETLDLWAISLPLESENIPVTWSVSDEKIIKIDKTLNGAAVIHALDDGMATITARTASGLTAKTNITVTRTDFRTNLYGFSAIGGSWEKTADGLRGIGMGNSPIVSQSKASDFTYEATIKYEGGYIGTALIFRASDNLSVYYSADINEAARSARILKFHRNPDTGGSSDMTLGTPFTFEQTANRTYKLKVVAKGNRLQFYVNDVLAVDTTDNESMSGLFGLNVCDATAVWQDVYYSVDDPQAQEVIDKIAALGDITSPSQADAVKEARGAYNALSESQKTLVDNLPVLIAAEESIEKLTVRGDLTGDGTVNLADIVMLRNWIMVGDPSAERMAKADLDNNGSINLADIVALRNIIMA